MAAGEAALLELLEAAVDLPYAVLSAGVDAVGELRGGHRLVWAQQGADDVAEYQRDLDVGRCHGAHCARWTG